MSIHFDPTKVSRGAVLSKYQDRSTFGDVLYLHHVPGRLRVRLSALVRNEPAARILRLDLPTIAGVRSVSVNSTTGSLLVQYDRDSFELDAFWMALRSLGHIDWPPRALSDTAVNRIDASVLPAFANAAAEALIKALIGRLLERSAVMLIGLLV
ncbi:HMA2 domain-containing protein [Methylocystis sp.]|uniref:HMA2 domain-containing protein n=1 Tax=Methylocystis sp. TaxID=1911079 RepID=UPI003DA5A5F6